MIEIILGNTETPFGQVTSGSLLAWLACGWLVLKLVSEGMGMVNRITGKEPLGKPGSPVVTRKEERLLTIAEWTALEKRVAGLEERFADLIKQLGVDFAAMTKSGEERATRLMRALTESSGKQHTRIDEILKAVARLEGTVEQMNR